MDSKKKHLVLLGAGHTHALALSALATSATKLDCKLTLVCGDRHVAYSGMMPGAIAKLYTEGQVYIDVAKLAEDNKIELIAEHASKLDVTRRIITLKSGELINYDLLSINVGGEIVPELTGDKLDVMPVKPVNKFLAWLATLPPNPARTIAIIGGGVAGAEVAMSIDGRLHRAGKKGRVYLVGKNEKLIANVPKLSSVVSREFIRRGISMVLGSAAISVDKNGVRLANGSILPATEVIVVTGVKAWVGLASSGLAVNQDGFVKVNRYLQSVDYPEVFAVGDCIDWLSGEISRAGVYAVRQAPTLATNLALALQEQPLQSWKGDKQSLAILTTGDGRAIAHRNGMVLSGRLVWRWKDYLDRKFMHKLNRQYS